MIQLTSASVSYPDGSLVGRLTGALLPRKYKHHRKSVLSNVTLWLGRGESWALLGKDEEGKTTLLRLIAGFIPPDEGHCSVEGKVAAAIRGEDGLIASETGENNVILAYKLSKLDSAKMAYRIDEVEEMAGLATHFRERVSEYDENMRARLAISMAIAENPDILVISNLLERCGLPYMQRYVTILRRNIKNGMSLLMESSDAALLGRVCESALLIENGGINRLGLFENVYADYVKPHVLSNDGNKGQGAIGGLEQARVAFSEPLAPDWQDRPSFYARRPEEKDTLIEAEYSIRRLNDQVTAYAKANLAYEEQNQQLQIALHSEKARAKQAEDLLGRVFRSVADTMRVMHQQFVYLSEMRKKR